MAVAVGSGSHLPVAPEAVSQRAWRIGLIAIVAVAALTRVALILATPHFTLYGDPADYQRHAVSIAAGHGFPTSQIATPGTPSAFRPPAYPFLLGGVYAIVGTHPQAGRLLGAALGVLTVVLLAYLGRAIWSWRIGLLAGGLAAIFPPLVDLNATLLSESLFVPVELGAALCLVACWRRPGQIRWALLAGALCGLAVLTRAVADAWLVPTLAVVILAAGVTARVKLRSAAAVLVAFLLVVTPWTVRNLTVFHAFVPASTEGGFTLAGQYNVQAGRDDALQAVWRLPYLVPSIRRQLAPYYRRPGGIEEPELDHKLRSAGLSYLGHHPGHLPVAVVLDTLRLFDVGKGHTFTTGVYYRQLDLPASLRGLSTWTLRLAALIALMAVVLAAVGRRRLGPWWVWALPLITLALTVPMVGNPLKRAPLDPFLLLLVALSLEWAWQLLRRSRSGMPGQVSGGGA